MQTSGNELQFYNGHFHRTYLTTIERGGVYDLNRRADEIVRPINENMQSSDDNGLPFMNLLVLEGLAMDSSVTIPDRHNIISLLRLIIHDINLKSFILNNKIVFNFEDGQQSSGTWDRLSAEGPIILAAMLLSGQISLNDFYNTSQSFENHPVLWRMMNGDLIEVNKPSYHSAMFGHGLRAFHGIPISSEEFNSLNFFETSLKPVLLSHIDYSSYYQLKALGSQVMTQALFGVPVFERAGKQVQFPGNENNFVSLPESHLSKVTGPHGWFVPMTRFRNLDNETVDLLFEWISSYENDFFKQGADTLLGWEAAIPWHPSDTTYSWTGSDGSIRYTDWGRPFEALNTAYIVLSIFDALNPDRTLASYNVEYEKIKHIANYYDNQTLIPIASFMLLDAIKSLKICAGIDINAISIKDINGDFKIGIEEAIYGLQSASGLRD